jgi:hypothetical protein
VTASSSSRWPIDGCKRPTTSSVISAAGVSQADEKPSGNKNAWISKEGTAEGLMEWLANKDRDLSEREGGCWEWE